MGTVKIVILCVIAGGVALAGAAWMLREPEKPQSAKAAAGKAVPGVTPSSAPPPTSPVNPPKITATAKPAPSPKGFRGIAWGENLAARTDMKLAEYQAATTSVIVKDSPVSIPDRHTRSYERTGDKRAFGTVAVESITYHSFDGRFYGVSISGFSPYELAAVFSQVYGEAKEDKLGTSRFWAWVADGGETSVMIGYSDISEFAHIRNVKLENQLDAVWKAEAEAELKKAKSDF